MLYIKSFKNYDEFRELFGIREYEGVKTRKNKILLSLLKDRETHRRAVETGELSLLSIRNMADLKNTVIEKIRESGMNTPKLCLQVILLGTDFYNDKYLLDEWNGVCTDGSINAVRYVNMENGKVFKMKAGKFMRHLIVSTDFGKTLPESIVNWLCEEFCREWESHALGKMPRTKLHVNDNFEDIYSSDRLLGYDNDRDSFGSCMVDEGQHYFYEKSVMAKAAYLENGEGMIIARCIIFTEVYDEDGKIWRYAERQYSYNGNEVYKQMLIEKLIEAGEIDCYKQIGAGCSEADAIVDVNGKSLAGKRFRIFCDIGKNDCVSYQDTFKVYDSSVKQAYNYDFDDCDAYDDRYSLDTTEGYIEFHDKEQFDSYNQRYADEVTPCYYHGNLETVDVEEMDDFIRYDGDWYHKDDLMECRNCGDCMLNPDYYDDADEDNGIFYSDVTGDCYCSDSCRELAEEEYRKENWFYSDYEDRYYPDLEDLTTCRIFNRETWEYEESKISVELLDDLVISGKFHEHEGEYYDCIDEETGQPYGVRMLEYAS